MKEAEICMRTGEPDYSDLPVEEYDWTKTVYGDITEIIPKDAPNLSVNTSRSPLHQCQPIP